MIHPLIANKYSCVLTVLLPFCYLKCPNFDLLKKQISPKEIIFWHTSELRTTVASEYVIMWSKNYNYPWSTVVLCVKNAWIFIFSPPSPPIHPCGFVSKLSRFPFTVQDTTAQGLKTVRPSGHGSVAFSSPSYLRSPVLQPPRAPPASHSIPFLTTRHGI